MSVSVVPGDHTQCCRTLSLLIMSTMATRPWCDRRDIFAACNTSLEHRAAPPCPWPFQSLRYMYWR